MLSAKGIIAVVGGYGAGVWFLFQSVRRTRLFRRAAWWSSTRGRILESVEYGGDANGKGAHFRVRYEFDVGTRIEGNTPRLCGGWFMKNGQQTAFVARYVPGHEVEVFYDPADPRINCLDRTDRSGLTAMWILGIGGTTLASLIVWLVWLESH